MIRQIKHNRWLLIGAIVFIALQFYFTLQGKWWISLLPFALIVGFVSIFRMDFALLSLAFAAPLSINIEEFTDGKFGMYIPTEPILILLLLLVLLKSISKPFLPRELFKNSIVWALGFYLFWVLLTSITSTHVLVSFKFLLMRLWFIVPLVFLGTYLFMDNLKRINVFVWLYVSAMCVVIIYTTLNHWQYGFGEKESHWVMYPFFKDHTSYGAVCAFNVPLIVGLFFFKKQSPLVQILCFLVLAITLTGLFFSYTRAAWLSVACAILVYACIRFKVRFRYLALLGLIAGVYVAINWTEISYLMGKNTSEHTTENFEKRIESAANITTDASNLERINRWSSAWAMFQKKPLLGFGPGTFAFEYAPFQAPENKTIISTNFGNLGNAHSEYLGPLAESGILGLVSMLLFVGAIFYKGITLYIRYPESENRILLLSFVLALSTYFVHAFLNNFLDTDKVAVPVFGLVAAIIAYEINLEKDKHVTH